MALTEAQRLLQQRRALIRSWFRKYLKRGFEDENEIGWHLKVLVDQGEDVCLANILDSVEGKAWLDRDRADLGVDDDG